MPEIHGESKLTRYRSVLQKEKAAATGVLAKEAELSAHSSKTNNPDAFARSRRSTMPTTSALDIWRGGRLRMSSVRTALCDLLQRKALSKRFNVREVD